MIYLLPLIAGVLYGISSLLNKKVTTIFDNPILSSILYNLSSFLVALLLITQDISTTGIIFSANITDWILVIIGSLICAFAYWAAFVSINKLPISEQILLSRFSVLTYTIGGFLILGETVTRLKFLGILLILCGVLVSSIRKGKFVFNKWALIQLLSSFGFGLNVLIDNYVSQNFSAGVYISINTGLTTLFLIGIAFCMNSLKGIKSIPKKYYLFGALTGIFSVLAYFLVIRSYDMGSLVVITGALSQLRLPVVVLGGYLFFKEKGDVLVKILGVVTVVVGLVLLKI